MSPTCTSHLARVRTQDCASRATHGSRGHVHFAQGVHTWIFIVLILVSTARVTAAHRQVSTIEATSCRVFRRHARLQIHLLSVPTATAAPRAEQSVLRKSYRLHMPDQKQRLTRCQSLKCETLCAANPTHAAIPAAKLGLRPRWLLRCPSHPTLHPQIQVHWLPRFLQRCQRQKGLVLSILTRRLQHLHAGERDRAGGHLPFPWLPRTAARQQVYAQAA